MQEYVVVVERRGRLDSVKWKEAWTTSTSTVVVPKFGHQPEECCVP